MEQMECLKRLNAMGMQSFFALTRQAVDQWETIWDGQMALGLAYMREAMDDAEALLGVSDSEGFGRWNADHFRPGMQRLLGVTRDQLGVTMKAQKELAAAMQSRFMELSRQTTDAIEEMGAQVPGSAKPMADAMRSLMMAMHETMENMGRVSSQLGELAESEVAAMAEAAGGDEGEAVKKRKTA